MSRKKVVHIHSNVYNNGEPQAPNAGVLEKGEIAVNYNDTEPALFIENNSGEIVKFNPVTYGDISAITSNISSLQTDMNDRVRVYGDETIGGEKNFNDGIVVEDASKISYFNSSITGYTANTAYTSTVTANKSNTITFTELLAEPSVVFIIRESGEFDSSNRIVQNVVFDSNTHAGVTDGYSHQFSTSYAMTYNNESSSLTISSPASNQYFQGVYKAFYVYGTLPVSLRKCVSGPSGAGSYSITFNSEWLTTTPAVWCTLLNIGLGMSSISRISFVMGENDTTISSLKFAINDYTNITDIFLTARDSGFTIKNATNSGVYHNAANVYNLYYLTYDDIFPQFYETLSEELAAKYEKPSNGIPLSDLADGVVPMISTNIVNDKTDNTKSASPAAVYTEVHPEVASIQPQNGMLPNVMYDFGTITANTTFKLATPSDPNIINHYYWVFDMGPSTKTITWPNGITWYCGTAPIIVVNKHYEISVLDGIAMYMEV